MEYSIIDMLFSLAEERYQKFTAKLIPSTKVILGVRLPKLRQLSKEIAKGDWRAYLKNAGCDYFEEIMLTGMIIGNIKTDALERLEYIEAFLPKIDNWSVCDSFCAGLKFTNKNLKTVYDFIQPYLFSENEFEVRFAIVMLMDYYINAIYIDKVLNCFDKISHEGYYVKMAVAWAVSVCFVKFPQKTICYLRDNNLDDSTYKKALQKIIESRRISNETRQIIRDIKCNRASWNDIFKDSENSQLI